MQEGAPSLGRFLPDFVRERCARHGADPVGYEEWPLAGALLFIDVVGFSARVERLAARGQEGVELANELLDDTIGRLVGELTEGGGDIVVFAGDALFVLWRQLDDERSLAPAIARAAAVALRAQERRPPDNPRFEQARLRFSLGAGPFVAHRVGGHADHWHCLLSGPALEQVGRAGSHAQNNLLVVSPEAWALAGGLLIGEMLEHGLRRVIGTRPREAVALPDPSPITAASLRHVPSAVAARGLPRDAQWLAEFRRPSVIFARLPGLLADGQLDGPRAHEATQAIQRIVSGLEGTTLQFVIDDKGPVFIIAFGLKERVHEDDPSRAALAALRIVAELAARGIACGVGVATGYVFCGIIGSERRCDYSVIGHTMNLAARLMQCASPGPLCDERTQELARLHVDFAQEGTLRVKGLEGPVPHYRATAARTAAAFLDDGRGVATGLVGRGPEWGILEGRLQSLVRAWRGGVVAMVGEAGIGKSRLARELVSRATSLGVTALVAAGGAIEATPNGRWVGLLRTLTEQTGVSGQAADDVFLRLFMGDGQAIPDVDDAERALRTREAIVRVIVEAATARPLLLCVEDTHWMDSLSWSLVARLAQRAGEPGVRLLLVLTTRELELRAPADALGRLAQSGMTRLTLGPLAMADRVIVAGNAIGVQALPSSIADWIARQSGGNPYFCRELAVSALESGRLRIVDQRAELAHEHVPGTGAQALPDTLQALIAARLDRLASGEQLCVRIASVIGPRFSADALAALCPGDRIEIQNDLDRLEARGFLDREPDASGDSEYAFNHILIRDAAYESLPYRRRRELHARLAAWWQERHAGNLAAQASTLAHHWECAEAWETAFDARLRAGEHALSTYANREAAEQFAAAAALRTREPALRQHLRAIHPELGLARAHHRMGDERTSRREIEDALRACGESLANDTLSRMTGVAREIGWRLVPKAVRRRSVRLSDAMLRGAVRAYDLLPEILYYDNDPIALAQACLRFLRLAEAEALPSPERARALGWYALIRSSVVSRAALDRTFDEAIAEAQAVGDLSVDAWLRLARGSTMAQMGVWESAEHWLRDAQHRFAAMGDRSRWWNVTSGLGHSLSYRGHLAQGAEVLAGAVAANQDTDNPLFLCWGLAGHAEILHRLGREQDQAEVVRLLRDARTALAQRPDPAADLFSRGLLCAALWREGQQAEAFDLVRDTVGAPLDRAPVVWLQVGSYLGLAEVLGEAARDPALAPESLLALVRLERSLRDFSRLIPVGRAVHALVRGEIALLRRDVRRARRV
ncbi:MAG TPA: AAA family ATPase, partial [Nevskiaceae bacterium]|nr:AAA family ATPase [Nevskiaceae bacterium]